MIKNKQGLRSKIVNIVLKHLQGQHNQKRHGWRYSGGIRQIRRGMAAGVSEDFSQMTNAASERDVYRDRISKLDNKPAGWQDARTVGYNRYSRVKPEYGAVIPKPKKGRPAGAKNKPKSYVPAKFTDPNDFLDTMRDVRLNEKQGISNTKDDYLQAIYKAQGFDGKPTIVSEKKMDSAPGEQYFRAVANEDQTRAFQSGDYYVGKGMYGNGTYAGKRILDAYDYGRHVLKIKAKKGSKWGTQYEISQKQSSFIQSLDARISAEQNNIPERRKLQSLRVACLDIGRFAAMSGYDGYQTDWGSYVVVLNRTATLVQNTFQIPSGTWIE